MALSRRGVIFSCSCSIIYCRRTLYSTIRVAVLLIPILCAEPLLAQDESHPSDKDFNPVAIGIAPESQYRRCFEPPSSARDAIRRLPSSARHWLDEDAVYIITPEERTGAGLAISAHIKDTGNVPSQGLFCHDSIPRNSWASALRLCLSCGLRRASVDGFHR
jgi:hypothetical protein